MSVFIDLYTYVVYFYQAHFYYNPIIQVYDCCAVFALLKSLRKKNGLLNKHDEYAQSPYIK